MSYHVEHPAPKPPWRLRYSAHLGVRSTAVPLFAESAGSTDPVEQIRYVADLGFAGVFDNALKSRTVADQERIGNALNRYGLELSSFVSSFDLNHKMRWGRRDGGWPERIRADLLESMEVARRVNCRVVSIISGLDEGIAPSEQLANMAENLRDVVGIAERNAITLVLEHVSDRRVPDLLLRRLDESLDIIARVGSPALGVMFDSHHVTAMDGDVITHYRAARERVPVVQLADYPDRAEPGTGEIDFPAFLRELVDSGFDGMIELEFIPSLPGRAGEQAALDAMRRLNASF